MNYELRIKNWVGILCVLLALGTGAIGQQKMTNTAVMVQGTNLVPANAATVISNALGLQAALDGKLATNGMLAVSNVSGLDAIWLSATEPNAQMWLRTSGYNTGIISSLSTDGINWTAIRNYPVGPPFARDVSTIRYDGKWVSVYTDAFNSTNKTFGFATSSNLTSWQNIKGVPLTGSFAVGTANNVWAPEWFVDGTNYYVLVRLSTNSDNYGPPGLGYTRALDPGTWSNWSDWTPFDQTIPGTVNDPFLVKTNGYYWFFAHGKGMADPYGKNIVMWQSTNAFEGYSNPVAITESLLSKINPGNGSMFFEGPDVKHVAGSRWRLYFQDGLTDQAYAMDSYDDFATWDTSSLRKIITKGINGGMHGTVVPIDAESAKQLNSAVAEIGTPLGMYPNGVAPFSMLSSLWGTNSSTTRNSLGLGATNIVTFAGLTNTGDTVLGGAMANSITTPVGTFEAPNATNTSTGSVANVGALDGRYFLIAAIRGNRMAQFPSGMFLPATSGGAFIRDNINLDTVTNATGKVLSCEAVLPTGTNSVAVLTAPGMRSGIFKGTGHPDWTSKITVSFSFRSYDKAAQEIRAQYGRAYNATTHESLSTRGVGLYITNGSVFAEAHNGTNGYLSSSAVASLDNSRETTFTYVVQSGTAKLYKNGGLVSAFTNCVPTNNEVANNDGITISVKNVSAGTTYFYLPMYPSVLMSE